MSEVILGLLTTIEHSSEPTPVAILAVIAFTPFWSMVVRFDTWNPSSPVAGRIMDGLSACVALAIDASMTIWVSLASVVGLRTGTVNGRIAVVRGNPAPRSIRETLWKYMLPVKKIAKTLWI
jgi:hypothetical protein